MTWKGLPPFRNGVRVVRYLGGTRVDIGQPMNGFDLSNDDFGKDDILAGHLKAFPGVSVAQVRGAE